MRLDTVVVMLPFFIKSCISCQAVHLYTVAWVLAFISFRSWLLVKPNLWPSGSCMLLLGWVRILTLPGACVLSNLCCLFVLLHVCYSLLNVSPVRSLIFKVWVWSGCGFQMKVYFKLDISDLSHCIFSRPLAYSVQQAHTSHQFLCNHMLESASLM